jgi:hypothetical protein
VSDAVPRTLWTMRVSRAFVVRLGYGPPSPPRLGVTSGGTGGVGPKCSSRSPLGASLYAHRSACPSWTRDEISGWTGWSRSGLPSSRGASRSPSASHGPPMDLEGHPMASGYREVVSPSHLVVSILIGSPCSSPCSSWTLDEISG